MKIKHLLSLLSLAVFFFIGVASSESDSDSTSSESFIEGLKPVDVYMNMDNIGFKTDKDLGSGYGNLWTSTMSSNGINYRVEAFSTNTSNVISVRGTAMVQNPSLKNIKNEQQFFIFLSSLPYNGSNSIEFANWLKDNYNVNEASITIGDAKFTLYAPSDYVRMLNIEKAK